MMLSNYERRVLNEIEVDLTRRRTRSRTAIKAGRLPMALLALFAVIGLSATAILPAVMASLLAAAFGVVVGWLLVNVVRHHVVGPRVRRRLRRASARRELKPR